MKHGSEIYTVQATEI